MTKIYSTLGRKFNKKDLEEAMRMGEEMVSAGRFLFDHIDIITILYSL